MSVPEPVEELLASALAAAAAASAVLLERARGSLEVGTKISHRDLVTDADRAAEAAIDAVLRERHPGHRLLAEEGTTREAAGSAAVRWIVDPLDGTVNFARGMSHYCVSIAAEDEQGLAVAVVQDPVRGEVFRAARGQGAWLGERRLQVSAAPGLADAILATGFSYETAMREENARHAAALIPRLRGFRRMGSAALDLAWVAAGRLDGFWELGLKPWDVAAGLLLVTEAGGVVSGMPGQAEPLVSGTVVAGGPAVHEALSAALAG
ncbi:MAG: inositol monophosphatase family protein [Deltaproteobacteria bacterium]|nr:inositol monophosphatase family protein [Deltaproteobacteria bacterium]